MATRLYILYLAADESISGWEFLLLIPKSPHSLSGDVLVFNPNNQIFRCSLLTSHLNHLYNLYTFSL